jgi:hypothetical protein
MIVTATGKSTTPTTVQSSKKDIDTLGKSAESWGMRFQPVKCNMMTLSRKKKTIENKYTMYYERHRTGIPNINKISWSEHM